MILKKIPAVNPIKRYQDNYNQERLNSDSNFVTQWHRGIVFICKIWSQMCTARVKIYCKCTRLSWIVERWHSKQASNRELI